MNVLLETNLDALIDGESTSNFMAARKPGLVDCCLWTGFVAAAPGHRVIGTAIENVVRAVLLRTAEDAGALERDLMGRSKAPYTTDVWKLRAHSMGDEDGNDAGEFVFKDCALGLAWNQVWAKENLLESIHVGGYEHSTADGREIILLVRTA